MTGFGHCADVPAIRSRGTQGLRDRYRRRWTKVYGYSPDTCRVNVMGVLKRGVGVWWAVKPLPVHRTWAALVDTLRCCSSKCLIRRHDQEVCQLFRCPEPMRPRI